MASTFHLDLVTPERLLFSSEVQQVRAPGVNGSFGVMAKHAPMLTALETGLIKITLPNGLDTFIAAAGGFMQVRRDKVIILADSAELSDEIDVDRAKATAAEARRLLDVPDSGIDTEEIRATLERAQNRLRIAQLK